MSDELLTLGAEEDPIADIVLGHVPRERYLQLWNEAWDGEQPTEEQILYEYATKDKDGAWTLNISPGAEGAQAVTISYW